MGRSGGGRGEKGPNSLSASSPGRKPIRRLNRDTGKAKGGQNGTRRKPHSQPMSVRDAEAGKAG